MKSGRAQATGDRVTCTNPDFCPDCKTSKKDPNHPAKTKQCPIFREYLAKETREKREEKRGQMFACIEALNSGRRPDAIDINSSDKFPSLPSSRGIQQSALTRGPPASAESESPHVAHRQDPGAPHTQLIGGISSETAGKLSQPASKHTSTETLALPPPEQPHQM